MNKSQFDKLSENYFNIKGGYVHKYYAKKKVNTIKKYVGQDFSVLDVGCGVGEHAKLLKTITRKIYGIDISSEMVNSANNNLGGTFAMIGDATRLPFPDSSFDIAYTSNTLHHVKELDNIKNTISEMARVTKKYVIIFELNSKNPFCKYLLFRLCPYDTGEERIPPKKEIINIANEVGLDVVEVINQSFMPMFCPKLLMPLFSKIEIILENIIPWISVGIVYVLEKRGNHTSNKNQMC